jgi:hypothetical protein
VEVERSFYKDPSDVFVYRQCLSRDDLAAWPKSEARDILYYGLAESNAMTSVWPRLIRLTCFTEINIGSLPPLLHAAALYDDGKCAVTEAGKTHGRVLYSYIPPACTGFSVYPVTWSPP